MKTIAERLRDTKRVRGFIIAYYIIGFAGLSFPLTRPFFEHLIGLSILISFFLMILFHQGWNIRFIIASLIIYSAGFWVEVAGVQTGVIFGSYEYHSNLGPKMHGTPLLLGINWLMLVYAVHHILLKMKVNVMLKPFIGGCMLVVYDVIMEPVAINWNMWQWEGGSVPIRNYIAWFVISVIFFVLLNLMKVRYKNRVSTLVLIAQACLFLLLNIIILMH